MDDVSTIPYDGVMTEPVWLDETQQHAWRSYLAVQGRLTARIGQQLQAGCDLSLPDFTVLVQLTDVPEQRLRITALAREMQWEKSRLSHHLRRMEARGLVRRESCPSDARGAFVVLTDAGRTAIEEAAPGHVETVRRLLFDGMTQEELDVLTRVFTRVLARLDAPE
jgi:DNA-binding MarR family transcriptional regulator